MKAEEAAIKLMAERGCVIVGIPPDEMPLDEGRILTSFAGGPLDSHVLIVSGESTAKAWNIQKQKLDAQETTERPAGSRFYRCRLVKVERPANPAGSVREFIERQCIHERCDEDGICRGCGKDCRGIH